MTPASSVLAFTPVFDFAQARAVLVGHHLTRFAVAAGFAIGLSLSSLLAQPPAASSVADAQHQIERQA